MKASEEKRKEILLSGFEALSSNYNDNYLEIGEIVGKMIKIDINIAVQMWEYLIKSNPLYVKTQEHESICDNIIGYAYLNISLMEISEIVISNNMIKESVFSLSGRVTWAALLINPKILSNELLIANELLEMLNANKYKVEGLFEILQCVIPSRKGNKITDEAFEFLSSWIERVKSKEERAKLNMEMLEFMEDDE